MESAAEAAMESAVADEAPIGAASIANAIGVLCLTTTFEKIPGHIRNPDTFGFPVVYRVVEGATPDRVVKQADARLLEPFLAAARDLEAAGVAAITSGCGFLVRFQPELAAAVGIPVYASSLIQLPLVARMLRPGQSIGVFAASKRSLTIRHLQAVGADHLPVRVVGMDEQPEFTAVVMRGERDRLDVDRLRTEVLDRADALASEAPDLGAVVIECTDLVPFAYAIQERLRVPVFDIVTLTEMVHGSLTRRPYA